MKYKCDRAAVHCKVPCYAEVDGFTPERCLFSDTRKAKWEPAEPEQFGNSELLPKLTAEVFNRPDCPDWAKWAAVDAEETAYWYSSQPARSDEGWYSPYGCKLHPIEGTFDASDWKHSLIERSAKQLPDWCEVGEWVWIDPDKDVLSTGYMQIEAIVGNTLRFHTGSIDFCEVVKQAHLRPYCYCDNLRALIGRTVQNTSAVGMITGYDLSSIRVFGQFIRFGTFREMFTFIDGSPCGVLEHLENGKWVE